MRVWLLVVALLSGCSGAAPDDAPTSPLHQKSAGTTVVENVSMEPVRGTLMGDGTNVEVCSTVVLHVGGAGPVDWTFKVGTNATAMEVTATWQPNPTAQTMAIEFRTPDGGAFAGITGEPGFKARVDVQAVPLDDRRVEAAIVGPACTAPATVYNHDGIEVQLDITFAP